MVARGVYWSGVSVWIRTGAMLAAFLLMAQLLGPGSYGVGALVLALVLPIEAIVGYTILDSLIQRKDLEPGHSSAMFWVLQAMALTFLTFGVLLGPTMAAFFDQPEIAYLLPLALFGTYLSASTATPYALLRRHMRFRAVAATITVSETGGAIAGVAFAFAGTGALSLVMMYITTAVLRFAFVWWRTTWRPRLGIDRQHFSDLLAFNMSFMGIKLVEALGNAVPLLIIGRVLGPVAVGQFSIALRLLDLVKELLMLPLQSVTFPVIARLQSEPARLRSFYLTTAGLAATIGVPAFVGVALTAPLFIVLALSPEWAATTVVLQILALIGLRKCAAWLNAAILCGMGSPALEFRIGVVNVTAGAVALMILAPYGPVAAAIAVTGAHLLAWPFGLHYVRQVAGYSIVDQLRPFFRPLWMSAAMAVVVLILQRLLGPDAAPLLVLVISVASGIGVYGLLLLIFGRRTVDNILGMIRQATGAHQKPA